MAEVILLSGSPGCGKTTLLRKVLEKYKGKAGGFYTRELREAGVRKGFEIVSLGGERGLLAHTDIQSSIRVGKYGVDHAALEDIGVQAIEYAMEKNWLVVIDEIGPMENYSSRFRQAVLSALNGGSPVLGTIVKRRNRFGDEVKRIKQVRVIEVTHDNRDDLVEPILAIISSRIDCI